MYKGEVVESRYTDDVIKEPLHPYTKALITTIPNPDPYVKRTELPVKESQSKMTYEGCRFRDRCPWATEKCAKDIPEINMDNRMVKCILHL
ncbi:TPA: hypothetical protein EYP83_01995 [Candidatus Geothermarchaeota archaeon]|nr:hypothetical protein [Candidatus Geothermarchaeota archaeon]HIQ13345.1 hypothetical protein [Thermoprotei archaeon]